jgi:LysM repeat protein
MRQRLSTTRAGFLVLVLLALALGSCERSAEQRAIQTEVPVDEPATTAEPIPGGLETPVPGETVVSAVTPASGTLVPQPQPTQAPAGGEATAAAPEPEATAAPAPTQGAAAQPTSPPAAQGQSVVHTVQPGETLSSIARRYGTTWQVIAQANGIVNPNQIYAGQQLRIGSSTSSGGTSSGATGCRVRHTVKQGEWVWQIARTYGASPYDILAANGLSVATANTIYPGTVLCIP